jgi:arylsulfate sulfotransferase
MRLHKIGFLCLLGIVALSAPVFATVTIVSLTPSLASPQKVGKTITWEATATDSGTGSLTFQFNVAPPGGSLALVKDFNVGKLSSGTWTAQPFSWALTGIEGNYKVQVVIKDFASGETASKTVTFKVTTPLTAGKPVVAKTANPLVALFTAASCPTGSTMRVYFQEQTGSAPATTTNWVPCHPPSTMTFELAGMYPKTAYNMYAETNTGGTITDGATLSFTTGVLPASVPFGTYTVNTAGTDTTNPVIIHGHVQTGTGKVVAQTATDLSGHIIWYYYPNDATHGAAVTRPLQNGGFLTLQDSYAWNPAIFRGQFLRQIDLAGNIVHETNIGVLQQQLLAMGAVDGGPCNGFPSPPPVGSACIGAFHHDAIQSLPNGYTAVLVDVEKIYPAGTQGDTSSDPVDIEGDMIIVLDQNWQVSWYWDIFNPAGGDTGYVPVSRTAVLDETCGPDQVGCPPMLLLGPGIAPLAHDWIHMNALYYWPAPLDGNTTGGDIIWSSRNQDLVTKIDYKDGAGTGNVLWFMGPPDLVPLSDFTFNNVFNDPWEWFSHQHDVGIENGGAGPMTIFDNGNTRVSPAPVGLGKACTPYDCKSRGMAVTFSQTTMEVTPILQVDLGYYSPGNGSAQLLADGNYFFLPAIIPVDDFKATDAFSLEVNSTPDYGNAGIILNLQGPEQYRGWQVPNLYTPPTT